MSNSPSVEQISNVLVNECDFFYHQNQDDVLEKLLLPLVVSGINLIMPMAFRIIASLERYRSPRTTINVNLAR